MDALPSGLHTTFVRWYLPKFSPRLTASPKISSSDVGTGGGMYRSTGCSLPRAPANQKNQSSELVLFGMNTVHEIPTLIEYIIGRLNEVDDMFPKAGKTRTVTLSFLRPPPPPAKKPPPPPPLLSMEQNRCFSLSGCPLS